MPQRSSAFAAADALAAAFLLADIGGAVAKSALRWCVPVLPPLHRCDPHSTTRYTDEVLEPLRKIGDPATDPLIKRIARQAGRGAAAEDAVREFLKQLVTDRYFVADHHRNRPYMNADLYRALRTWATEVVVVPAQVDWARVDRAAQFFEDHFFRIGLILGTSSLLEAYACWRGARVLDQTDYLKSYPNRRLAETMQFVIYVNAWEGFRKGGHAADAIRKVRLMHGCIRWLVQEQPGWCMDTYGVPINREDLLGTLVAFSAIPLRDLPKILGSPTHEEAEDHVYRWNIIGRMLGLTQGLLPQDCGEAIALVYAVQRRHQDRPSPEGQALASALLRYHQSFLGRWAMAQIGIPLIRHLAGDRVCDLLAIPAPAFVAAEPALPDAYRASEWGERLLWHDGVQIGGRLFKKYDLPASLRRGRRGYLDRAIDLAPASLWNP